VCYGTGQMRTVASTRAEARRVPSGDHARAHTSFVRPRYVSKGSPLQEPRAEQEERERRLLYVAMNRAPELLWISCSDKLTPFLG
jgi:ATP-dependent exoDNAse (exonuclease V) beta subunit